ncbi:adiponectin receptor protein [Anaeramoeba flamelloides]|uniref:Adiponectin receptor protein n=1 Tax=Anaeramoeba flamelloides TaxID=1746091 RepID=A0AAV7Y6A3_9EUKA|nr:adiponectin receptor protein [Anaeramoeba flamelloides]
MLDTDLNFSFSKNLYAKEITNILLNSGKVENQLQTSRQESKKQFYLKPQQKSNSKRKTKPNLTIKKPFIDLPLTTYSKLPKWLQFNEHIQSGYRFGYNVKNTFKSLFQYHNETVNIWTHLLGSLIFVFLIFYTFKSEYLKDATFVSKLFVISSPISAIICLLSSTFYHLFEQSSLKFSVGFLKMDLTGILIMITFSTTPMVYFLMAYSNKIYYSYTIVLLSIGIFFIVSIWGGFSFINKMVKLRAFLFVVLSGYCLLLPLHARYLETSSYANYALYRLFLQYGSFGIGLIFYLTKFPECMTKSNKYDIFGSSHQIWHVWIIIASVITYYSMFFLCKCYTNFTNGIPNNADWTQNFFRFQDLINTFN